MKKAGLALLCVLAIVPATADDANTGKRREQGPQYPVLRVPRLHKPPVIDGRVAPGEWDAAAAITGLVNHTMGRVLTPHIQQAVFFIGYNGKFLYLAMRFANPREKYPVAWSGARDSHDILQDDHVEWQICTHDRSLAKKRGYGFFKVMLNALGTLCDQWINSNHGTDNTWSIGGKACSTVTRRTWELEIAVATSRLGQMALDGKHYVMQLVRSDPAGQGLAYVGWGRGGWMAWDNFPEVIFDPDAPAFQLLELGAVEEGNLDAHMRLSAPAQDTEVELSVSLTDGKGKVVFQETRKINISARSSKSVRLQRAHLPLHETGNSLCIKARWAGKWLYHHRIKVNRLTPGQRRRFVDGWVASLGSEPPRAVLQPEERPGSLLARLAAARKLIMPLEERFWKARRKGRIDDAKTACLEMIRAAPSSPYGYYFMAGVNALKGRESGAIRYLEQAVDRGFTNLPATEG